MQARTIDCPSLVLRPSRKDSDIETQGVSVYLECFQLSVSKSFSGDLELDVFVILYTQLCLQQAVFQVKEINHPQSETSNPW